jgi:hypothetical protein
VSASVYGTTPTIEDTRPESAASLRGQQHHSSSMPSPPSARCLLRRDDRASRGFAGVGRILSHAPRAVATVVVRAEGEKPGVGVVAGSGGARGARIPGHCSDGGHVVAGRCVTPGAAGPGGPGRWSVAAGDAARACARELHRVLARAGTARAGVAAAGPRSVSSFAGGERPDVALDRDVVGGAASSGGAGG